MSNLAPTKIYKYFKNKKFSRIRASEMLMSLIENASEDDFRTQLMSLKFMGLVASKDIDVFIYLENLLISHLNEQIRGNAGSIIIKNFPGKAEKPIIWALKHEKSNTSIILMIHSLEKTAVPELNSLLKLKNYVKIEGHIFFPSGFYYILNLNSKSIENIVDIENIDNLTKLKKLYLNFNQITNINGLDNLSDLKSLNLQGNRIRKIGGLRNLKNLEFIYLNSNEISEIRGINHNDNLRMVQLFDNRISKIKGLQKLLKLEVLNLRNNNITEINSLTSLRNLKRLDLSNNQISEIKGLENLTKLEFLDLSYNKIDEIKGLKNLTKLRFLDLRHNKITELKGMVKLKKLQHLYLGFNRIIQNINAESLNHIKILDVKNTTNNNVPYSIGDVYNHEELDESSLKEIPASFKDIIFIPSLFKSMSVLKELKSYKKSQEYFTNSTWIVIWKNNESELFQMSKTGKINWLRKSRSRNIREKS